MTRSFDAIVIGGGLAGTIAARDLRNAGHSTLLIEARDRLGGRTLYRPFADTDHEVEFGGTFFEPTHENMAREIARYGLELTTAPESTTYLWRIGGESRTGVPFRLSEAPTAERALVQLIRDARRIAFGVPHDHQRLSDLDIPVSAWADKFDLPTTTRDLLYTWCSLYTGTHVDDCSMLHILHRVAGVDNSPFGLIAGLGTTFTSGTRALVDALVSDADPEVRLNTPVREVKQTQDEVTITTHAGELLQAAAVVVAIPINLLGSIEWSPSLNAARRELARERHAGVGFKVWLRVEGPPSDMTAFGWDVGNITWLASEPADRGTTLIAAFGYQSPGFGLHDAKALEAALEPYLPKARLLAHDAHDWNADPWSAGAWLAYRPGQSTRLMSALAEPEQRLLFAGSDVAFHWPGRMEGALESGRRAAAQALELIRLKALTH